jgi:hypothetical protein
MRQPFGRRVTLGALTGGFTAGADAGIAEATTGLAGAAACGAARMVVAQISIAIPRGITFM